LFQGNKQICIGWLQWHLLEVRIFKTNMKWKYGTIKSLKCPPKKELSH